MEQISHLNNARLIYIYIEYSYIRFKVLTLSGCLYIIGHMYESLQNEDWPLTGREKQVLDLLCLNLTSKQIASKLCISKRTVDNHCYKICRKMSCKSRFDAVRLWQQPL